MKPRKPSRRLHDPFCPRHGRKSAPAEILGLRCDCPEILDAALGALKRGKWISAATMCDAQWPREDIANGRHEPFRCECAAQVKPYQLADGSWTMEMHPRGGDEAERSDVEDRGNQAVAEAIMAGYDLGLRGGVPREHVHRCRKCGQAFFSEYPQDESAPPEEQECLTCFAEANP